MKNKKGFTLVELIVVVAISSVLMVAVGISFSTIFVNKTKAASKVVYNMLGSTQNIGMSKDKCFFALQANANGFVTAYTVKQDGTGYKIIDERDLDKVVVVAVYGGTSMTIDADNGIMFEIDRTTGGFKNAIKCKDKNWGAGTSLGSTCTDIIIKSSKGDYDIVMNPKTGKYFYK